MSGALSGCVLIWYSFIGHVVCSEIDMFIFCGHIFLFSAWPGSDCGERVRFSGSAENGEVVEITHKSSIVSCAEGACEQLVFLKDKDTGLSRYLSDVFI